MGNAHAAPAPRSPLVLEETTHAELLQSYLKSSRLKDLVEGIRSRDLQAIGSAGARAAGHQDAQGFTPLHLVLMSADWPEGVECMLKAGADANAASKEGYTPLMLAALTGSLRAARLLTEHGAALDARSKRGSNVVHFAAQAGPASKAVLRHLLSLPASGARGVVSAQGYRGRNPLSLAVLAHGDGDVVRMLTAAGADASSVNPETGRTCLLHSAASLGRTEGMRALLEAGADPNYPADDGITPLMEVFLNPSPRHASESKRRRMFQLLCNAGANVNAVVPGKGFTVLHFALAFCRDRATVDLLLESGVNPSIGTNRALTMHDPGARQTMLHAAAKNGWEEVVDRLVAAGGDMAVRDKEQFTPLGLAVIYKRQEAVAALLRLGADPETPGPDCYPSYSTWKAQRGLRAMQALMNMEQPEGGMDALLAQIDGDMPQSSAVDLAACVTQHIPTVEAFLEHCAAPSQRALDLGAAGTPILRELVARPMWTPELHARLPRRFRQSARELLLCLHRSVEARPGARLALPPDVVALVLQKAAFPVSTWADPLWLTRQRTQAAAPAAGAGGAGPAGGQAGAAAAGGGAAGGGGAPGGLPGLQLPAGFPMGLAAGMQGMPMLQLHLDLPPGMMPQGGGGAMGQADAAQMIQGIMQQVMQQVMGGQQGPGQDQPGGAQAGGVQGGEAGAPGGGLMGALGGGGAQGGPPPHWPFIFGGAGAGPVGAAAAAAAGGGGGGGAAQGEGGAGPPGMANLPAGVNMVQHHQVEHPAGELHVMQFEINAPLLAPMDAEMLFGGMAHHAGLWGAHHHPQGWHGANEDDDDDGDEDGEGEEESDGEEEEEDYPGGSAYSGGEEGSAGAAGRGASAAQGLPSPPQQQQPQQLPPQQQQQQLPPQRQGGAREHQLLMPELVSTSDEEEDLPDLLPGLERVDLGGDADYVDSSDDEQVARMGLAHASADYDRTDAGTEPAEEVAGLPPAAPAAPPAPAQQLRGPAPALTRAASAAAAAAALPSAAPPASAGAAAAAPAGGEQAPGPSAAERPGSGGSGRYNLRKRKRD